MRYAGPPILLLTLGCAAVPLTADTLVLRDGKTIEGTLLSASARQMEFLPSSGRPVKLPIDTVQSLTVSQPQGTGAASPSPRQPARAPVILPANTPLSVSTIDSIDVDTTKAGARFRGSLDDPIMSGGDVIVPRGAAVMMVAAKVQQGGKMKGSDLIELKVIAISVAGHPLPVVTIPVETKSAGEGKKTAGKVMGGVGLGALIGGIAGGGKGALIGVVAGAAGGTILAATGQPHLKIPPETRLDFRLAADWKIR